MVYLLKMDGWPIEIDGLPNLKMGGSFHGYVTNNQMVNLSCSDHVRPPATIA